MAVPSPSLTKAIPISHRLVRLRQHLDSLRARERTRAREIIEEFSLGSIASPVRTTASRARRYHGDHAGIGAGLVGAAWHCRSRSRDWHEKTRARLGPAQKRIETELHRRHT